MRQLLRREGLKYILEALQLAEEINHRARIAMYCGAAAETEFTMNHFDAAQRYIERAIQLEREDGRQMKLRVRLAQKAAILLGMKQHQEVTLCGPAPTICRILSLVRFLLLT